MAFLDLRTTIFFATILCFLMSVVLFTAHLSYPKPIAGLGLWAVGGLCMMVSGLLFGLRNLIDIMY